MEQRVNQTTVKIIKRADHDGPGTLVGYGAVFYDGSRATEFELWPGVIERVGRSAFDKALGDDADVRGLFNHNPDNLLGRTASGTMRLFTDEKGLRYEIDLADTVEGVAIAAKVERGDLSGSSFSFELRADEWEKKDDGTEIRTLKEVRLFDVGPVVFPAYDATTAGIREGAGVFEEAKVSLAAFREGCEQVAKSRRSNMTDASLRLLELDEQQSRV